MEHVRISPLAISKILQKDLMLVIYLASNDLRTVGHLTDKEIKYYKKKYKNELYSFDRLPMFINKNAVSDDLRGVCILREMCIEHNKYPIALAQKIVKNKQRVAKISFEAEFKYIDMLLTSENKRLVLDVTAKHHLMSHGRTRTYINRLYGNSQKD